MPQKGRKKSNTPRKAYAQKVQQRFNANKGQPGLFTYTHETEKNQSPFSMLDAAWGPRHHGSSDEKQLRFARINFVTATSSETEYHDTTTLEVDDLKQELHNDHIDGSIAKPAKQPNWVQSPPLTEPPTNDPCLLAPCRGSSSLNTIALAKNFSTKKQHLSTDSFFMDTQGEPMGSIITPAHPEIEVSDVNGGATANASDSDEEVVLFAGRNANSRMQRTGGSPAQSRISVRIVEDEIRAVSLESRNLLAGQESSRVGSDKRNDLTPSTKSRSEDKDNINTMARPGLSAEDQALEDYLANTLEQGHSDIEVRALRTLAHQSPMLGMSSNKDEEQEEDEPDTEDTDEEYSDEGEPLDSYSSDEAINSEDKEPNEELLDQATLAMSDEQFARRLAKQEELGLGSNKILLWDGEDMAGLRAEGEDCDIEMLRNAANIMGQQKEKRSRRYKGSMLPQIMDDIDLADGDDYGDFDVMDFSRPSVQRKGKGTGINMPFTLSDSELEANMIMTWENDRKKKKQRKQKREQMRTDGLLGGGENAQLMAKYPGGIRIVEVKEEIKIFLASNQTSLPLVPMDKRARKTIHEIAQCLKLRSKSKGDGLRRYPCLFKTSHTLDYDNPLIDSLLTRFGLHHSSKRLTISGTKKVSRNDKTYQRVRGGKSIASGVSYQDGETVGAAAPALGSNNRGHALLSKMGWKLGTALGALDNKGSLEPVSHIVKATRAGLG